MNSRDGQIKRAGPREKMGKRRAKQIKCSNHKIWRMRKGQKSDNGRLGRANV